MSLPGIYGVLHRQSGRWYVGRSADVPNRWRLHRKAARRKSRIPFHEALRAHPATDFTWIMLQPCAPVDATKAEQSWIARLDAFVGGFNCTAGGDSTPSDDADTLARMSAAGKARTDRPFQGRRHSQETIARLREAARSRGPEWRQKISESRKGQSLSESHRAKLSSAMAGRHAGSDNPFFGRRHSEATRLAYSTSRLGKKRKVAA